MNVLFISLGELDNLEEGSVHIDLMKRFSAVHEVYIICKREKRRGKETELIDEFGLHVLHVKTGNIKNTSLLEKGISTIMVEPQFLNAAKTYLRDIKFDLVIYTTPPITIEKVVKYIKNRDGAMSYLLLKDIFPQNAIDIGMMTTSGIRGIAYRFFRYKEKKLYELSDYIGCMSKKNCEYLLKNNSEISDTIVHICPNSMKINDKSVLLEERNAIRRKYSIPIGKKVFVYGGNLGKPQGIPFMIECLKRTRFIANTFFLIVGNGTEYELIDRTIKEERLDNVRLMQNMPKADYDTMVGACDVGLIFLDYRFTIPNFPSRILSYMQAGIPVIACTDPNTDFGEIIEQGGFGWWCLSNNSDAFVQIINKSLQSDLQKMGKRGFQYLAENWDVNRQYNIMIDKIEK